MATLKPFPLQIAILLACLLLGAPVADAAPKAPVALAFLDEQSTPHSLAEFQGKFVLLNLWATWCGPCVAEMPELARLNEDYAKNNLTVIALSVDSKLASVSAFLRRHESSFKGLLVFWDSRMKATASLGVGGLPTTLLLDPEGNEIGRFKGRVDWKAKETRANLDALIARAKPVAAAPGAKVIRF